MIVGYIDAHRDEFGVEPITTTLTDAGVPIAPSSYYAARHRQPSARAVRDEQVSAEIARVHRENYGVYGEIGLVSPAEFETSHRTMTPASREIRVSIKPSS